VLLARTAGSWPVVRYAKAGNPPRHVLQRRPGGSPLRTVLALLLCPADPGDLARLLDLYEMTAEQARLLDGFTVVVFPEAGCPVDVGAGYTVVGGTRRTTAPPAP
jgi:hypothetical protein